MPVIGNNKRCVSRKSTIYKLVVIRIVFNKIKMKLRINKFNIIAINKCIDDILRHSVVSFHCNYFLIFFKNTV